MKDVHERLRWARRQAGFRSAAAFARDQNIPEVTYRAHENGSRGLKLPQARDYARRLGISTTWLLTGVGQPKPGVELSPTNKPVSFVPVISWVQAGAMSYNFADLEEVSERIPVIYHRNTLFALKVRGTSMNKVALPDDYIIVDYEDRIPVDRKLYVVEYEGQTTFKRYRDSNGPVRLEPDSTEPHETIFPNADFRIIGRVIMVQRSL